MLIPYWFEKKQFDKEELLKLESSGKKEECVNYIHSMKGAARNLGAEKLGDAAQHLEDIYRGRKEGDKLTAINDVEKLVNDTSEALKEIQNIL